MYASNSSSVVPRSSRSMSRATSRAMPPVANSESTTLMPSIWLAATSALATVPLNFPLRCTE